MSNSGLVTAVAEGTATITVTCGNQTKTCVVTVKEPLFTGVNKTITDPENAMPNGDVTIVDKNLSNGIVIKDKNNREWVWIVVPKTIFTIATSSTQYDNIKNDLITYAGLYRKTPSGEGTSYSDQWYSGCGIDSSTDYINKYYNKMLSSVYTNGGFWIQRYEDGEVNISCSNAQKKASGFTPDSSKTSSLLFGIQWDLVCKYLEVNVTWSTPPSGKTNSYYLNEDSSSWGRYKDNSLLAKSNETKKANIYDFAGNYSEWTLEKSTFINREVSHRGGSYFHTSNGDPAYYRRSNLAYSSAYPWLSFRATFY